MLKVVISQTQEDAVREALHKISCGYDKRVVVERLLLEVFPNEDPVFLAHWAGFVYVSLQNTAEPSRKEWILRNMVSEVDMRSAHKWYESYQKERERKSPYVY